MLAVKENIHAQENRGENLSLSLRNLILDELTENAMRQSNEIEELTFKVKAGMDILPLSKQETFHNVLGVDAGSQIIPLASAQYAVIGALAYSLPDGKRFFLDPMSLSQPYSSRFSFRGLVDIRRETMLYETAEKYIMNGSDTELVFIDGPLALSDSWTRNGFPEDRKRLVDSIKRLLTSCKERGIVIAGVVKRPSSRYLINILGLHKETEFTDSFLMHHTLSQGEMTEVFSTRMGMHSVAKRTKIQDACGVPIYSSYLRLTNDWQIPPIRLDVPDFCIDRLIEVANYSYSTSYWNGVPFPIVKADEAVKVSKRFISDVYSEVLGRISRINGDVAQVAPFWGESGWMGV